VCCARGLTLFALCVCSGMPPIVRALPVLCRGSRDALQGERAPQFYKKCFFGCPGVGCFHYSRSALSYTVLIQRAVSDAISLCTRTCCLLALSLKLVVLCTQSASHPRVIEPCETALSGCTRFVVICTLAFLILSCRVLLPMMSIFTINSRLPV
jgi:hypothetical protein